MKFFRREFFFAKSFAGFIAGIGSEKKYQKFARFDVRAFCERIIRDDRAEFLCGAKNDLSGAFEFVFDPRLNALGNEVEVALAGLKNDIAALEIGLRALKFERGVKIAEGIHFESVMFGQIDSAQHGNDDGHRSMEISGDGKSPALSNPESEYNDSP